MDLQKIIHETEKLGVTVLFCDMPTVKGRYAKILDRPCIYIDKSLGDLEKINIILHERAHHTNGDLDNDLSFAPTFSPIIENKTEKERILDFMSLVNSEYPIDDSFNYIQYMEHACIHHRYENFVKEISQNFYEENKRKGII